ncbi:MAG: outer membrane protein assembly factor BamD [Prevotella sp.]|nr:outer membrane protein assembly factor BamD [Prevotella sp.]
MKKIIFLLLCCLLVLTGCGEYNTVIKHGDPEYKYEVAKACYARGKYLHAYDLLNSVVINFKGSSYGEECLYLMAMSAFKARDYDLASSGFKKYYQSYPRGLYVEESRYHSGLALYQSVPDPRLDQTATYQAIAELQNFLDYYPYTRLKDQTQDMLQRLQDHLIDKEQRSAQLYYDLGNYIGNSTSGGSNYEACIVTSENALRDFPYASAERREQFMILILRSRYHLARQSVEEKRMQRFRQTVDEYYGFINEFPESAYRKEAEGYLKKSQKALAGQPLDED